MEILGVSYLLTGPTELVSCRIKGLHLVAEVPGGHLGFESFTLPKLRDLGRWWFVLLLVFLLMCLQVVSLRGHGGWSAGFQSHERAFSCTSIGKEDLEDCGSRAAVAKGEEASATCPCSHDAVPHHRSRNSSATVMD
ncbi:uncharacterized protein isoform X9 [Castor canadensis]|uniref:Uncharacterized protein isoform X9 n=4 Tax=Castor canadensis TaxID=51338 RepID=A0AC58LPK0_CASCN